ncbi:MAG: 50S ribosomal protein L9 [Patescibacteria group bacterium]
MKIILLKEVKPHGKEGDVIEVSEGYARNFLFPQHAGIQASPAALVALKQKKQRAVNNEQRTLTKARELATKFDGMQVTVVAKANEHGKLFAAVSEKDILKALKKEAGQVEVKCARFIKPIKEVGEFAVNLELPHGLEAEIQLIVEAGM